MTDRPQINVRLDRDLLTELDELATLERVDRSEMARRVLDDGLAARRSARALEQYRQGRVSAWKAAETARVSLYEMLDRIHEAGIPHEVDPDVLDRLSRRDDRTPGTAAIREQSATYRSAGPDASSGIAELREQFRPEHVRWLFVGESSPAGGTHFYRANSNLFYATREAYAEAFGADHIPAGPAFLHAFREAGAWLVDLATAPVNRLSRDARADAVEAGVPRLAQLITEVRPERIVAVKASIADAVREAARQAGFTGDIIELPFPVRQWRGVYVRRLAAALGSTEAAVPRQAAPPSEQSTAPVVTRRRAVGGPARTQRVTKKDLEAGRIRIPRRSSSPAKSMLPQERSLIRIRLRGHEQSSRYDPHYDADQERSGVISVERAALARLVRPDEVLTLFVDPDGTVELQ